MSDEELALLREGVQLHNAGDFVGAINLYRKALMIDASNATAHHQIGFAYMMQGAHVECLAAAKKGIEVTDQPMAELFGMAASCADDLERYDEAAEYFAEGHKWFPSNQRLLYNYAVHKARIDEAEAALDLTAASLDEEAHHASSHYLAAMLLGHRGRDDLAILAALRFLSLEPAGDRALSILGVMESLFRRQEVALATEEPAHDEAATAWTAEDQVPGANPGAGISRGTSDAGNSDASIAEAQPATEGDGEGPRDEGIDIGSIQVAGPLETEEQQERLIDVVQSAVAASTSFSPDGEPRFPTYSRRSDIVTLIVRAKAIVDNELSPAEKRIAVRYGSFFGGMHEAGIIEAFSQYVLQMVAEEVQGWAADNSVAVEQLGLFLRSR